jgi:uncharacterized protein (DUF1810 family)
MNKVDPYNLQRFVAAQSRDYEIALGELRRGRKESHWIWYIFPQVAGLGHSSMAQRYAIQSRDEAIAYLKHDILGARLEECANVLVQLKGKDIDDIMGYPDNLKLRSSMTLFAVLSPSDNVFQVVLDNYFEGQQDGKTLAFLSRTNIR